MRNCSNCDEKLEFEALKEGVCAKCGAEISYGSEGCAG